MTTQWNPILVLLLLLAAAAAEGEPTPPALEDKAQMVAVDPQALKFTEIPDMPSCVTSATLRGDPRSGPAWVMLKLASGCKVPWHWHTPTEDLVVISGRGTLEMKDGPPLQLVPGAYASMPSHHAHQATCSEACLFFTGADGAFDIHYVDAKGEEISTDRAMGKTPETKGAK